MKTLIVYLSYAILVKNSLKVTLSKMPGTFQDNNNTRTSIVTVSLNSKEWILNSLIHFNLVILDFKNTLMFFSIRKEYYGESNLVSPLTPGGLCLIWVLVQQENYSFWIYLISSFLVSLTASSYFFENCMKNYGTFFIIICFS